MLEQSNSLDAVDIKQNFISNQMQVSPKYPDSNQIERSASLAQVESTVWQGIKLEQNNKLPEAIEHYRQAVELNSESAVAHHILAIALKKQGNVAEADYHHRLAVSLGNKSNLEAEKPTNALAPLPKSGSKIVLPKITAIAPGTYVENNQLEIAKVYLQQAKLYYQQSEWQKSIIACQQGLKICPDLPEIYKICGNCLQQLGKTAEALGCYAQALTTDPNIGAEVYANIGSLYAKQNNWPEAVEYYQKALSTNPQLGKVCLHLSRAWEQLGEDERALNCLLQALDLEPSIISVGQHLQLADDLLAEGRIQLAINCYEHALKIEPHSKAIYQKIIKSLEQNGQWERVSHYYHRLVKLQDSQKQTKLQQPSKKRIQNLLSSKNSQKNNYLPPSKSPETKRLPALGASPQDQTQSRAEPDFKIVARQYIEQLQKEPNSTDLRMKLGNLLARNQQWQQASLYYQQVIGLKPDLAIAYLRLGKIYGILGKGLEGVELIHRAYSLQPDIVTPQQHDKLGDFWVKHNQNKLAMGCYRRAIGLEPNFKAAYNKLQNLIKQATQANQTAPQTSSETSGDRSNKDRQYFNLGTSAAQEKNWSLALQYFQQAIRHNPLNWEAYERLGRIFQQQQQWTQATKCYQQAIAINPENHESYYSLGKIQVKLEK